MYILQSDNESDFFSCLTKFLQTERKIRFHFKTFDEITSLTLFNNLLKKLLNL
jgi:hypothetical protein